MQAIPKPWCGGDWQRELRNRELQLGPLTWSCVDEFGVQSKFRFRADEAIQIQAARLEIWPLSPVKS